MLEFNPNVTAKTVTPYGDGDEKTGNKNEIATGVIHFGYGETEKNEPNGTGLNPYGDDVANFMEFGDGLSTKAMAETIEAKNAVEKALINSEISDGISFPPAPDPNKFGKGEDGFNNYLTALHHWQDNCLMIIEKEQKRQSEDIASAPIPEDVQDPIENTFSEKVKGVNPVKPEPEQEPEQEPVRINVDYNAALVREASRGWGTDEKKFIRSVTVGPQYNYLSYNEILGREPLNKTEVWALNDEILNQTNGQKSLLGLMEEEFRLHGGLFRSNRKITELYELYKNYLSDTSVEKG